MQKNRPVALVTGASRNLGRAIARSLAEAGHAVACLGRDRAALDETVGQILAGGGSALPFTGDVGAPADLTRFVEEAQAAFGGIDVVVNNAGAVRESPAAAMTPAEFAHDLQVNLVSCFALARSAHAALKAGGRGVVINIGSIAGAMAFPRAASYCASKAGIEGLTRALALDWARDRIRVLCVAPGYVEPGLANGALADEKARAWVTERIPQRRLGRPEEIARFVTFLASEAASFATGETYYVDGGQRAAI